MVPCGKQILRGHSYSSEVWEQLRREGLILSPSRGCRFQWILAFVRWKRCRAAEAAAHPQHCPVPLTAPGSPPAPNDSHLSPSLPTSSPKPALINLFFSSPVRLHPSGGPLGFTFPLPVHPFFHSYSFLVAIRAVVNTAGCAQNPLPASRRVYRFFC